MWLIWMSFHTFSFISMCILLRLLPVTLIGWPSAVNAAQLWLLDVMTGVLSAVTMVARWQHCVCICDR